MIKRIIFDIDNTLIDFPETYKEGYQQVLDKYKVNKTYKELYDAIGVYEECGKYNKYTKEELLSVINKELDLNLNKEFLDDYFDMYNNLETNVSDNIKNTLEYLSKKYELVTLSNWFTFSQKERLKIAGIDKYFKEVYGTDIVPMKPTKESFLSVIGNHKIEECLMVGDNIEMDIKVPYELGMNVLYFSKGKNSKYPSINKFEELKEML